MRLAIGVFSVSGVVGKLTPIATFDVGAAPALNFIKALKNPGCEKKDEKSKGAFCMGVVKAGIIGADADMPYNNLTDTNEFCGYYAPVEAAKCEKNEDIVTFNDIKTSCNSCNPQSNTYAVTAAPATDIIAAIKAAGTKATQCNKTDDSKTAWCTGSVKKVGSDELPKAVKYSTIVKASDFCDAYYTTDAAVVCAQDPEVMKIKDVHDACNCAGPAPVQCPDMITPKWDTNFTDSTNQTEQICKYLKSFSTEENKTADLLDSTNHDLTNYTGCNDNEQQKQNCKAIQTNIVAKYVTVAENGTVTVAKNAEDDLVAIFTGCCGTNHAGAISLVSFFTLIAMLFTVSE